MKKQENWIHYFLHKRYPNLYQSLKQGLKTSLIIYRMTLDGHVKMLTAVTWIRARLASVHEFQGFKFIAALALHYTKPWNITWQPMLSDWMTFDWYLIRSMKGSWMKTFMNVWYAKNVIRNIQITKRKKDIIFSAYLTLLCTIKHNLKASSIWSVEPEPINDKFIKTKVNGELNWPLTRDCWDLELWEHKKVKDILEVNIVLAHVATSKMA